MFIPLSTGAIILNLKAIVVMLLSLVFLGDNFTIRKLMLVLVSMIGTILIIDPEFVLYLVSFLVPSVYQPGDKPAIPGGEPGMLHIFVFWSVFRNLGKSAGDIMFYENIQ